VIGVVALLAGTAVYLIDHRRRGSTVETAQESISTPTPAASPTPGSEQGPAVGPGPLASAAPPTGRPVLKRVRATV
jgi:hypothetical protein